MSDFGLVPKYTEADFQTLTDRLKAILSKTDTFKDYDFEGANITLLMELLSYVGDLNTFYTNRLAQNIHSETANIYEVVHSLSRQQGYVPTGYVSSEVTLTVRVRRRDDTQTISYFDENDQMYIPKWFKVNTGLTTTDGDIVYYCMAEDHTFNVTDLNIQTDYDDDLDITYEYVEFDITMKQGEPLQAALEYTGDDIISNQIVLPLTNYDMGVYPYEDTLDSILVTVGSDETPWNRVSDFFDDISGLTDENNAYILYYDKYKRTVLSFSNTRNIPTSDDVIKIYPIKTLGTLGAIASNTFGDSNKPDTDTVLGVIDVPFLTNITTDDVIPTDRYTVVNSSASVGGSDAQEIEELKEAGKAYAHSQLRNVTKVDYIGNLESRGDITVANVWGEHEQNPDVLNSTYFNRAYISLIPTEWSTDVDNNISLSEIEVDDEFSGNITGNPAKTLLFPENYSVDSVYNPTWQSQLLDYLEPRKMLGIWEEFILPELVYFRFDFGLKVKRTYSFTKVKEAIKNKLEYYFQNNNRNFGEIIDFREVYNYVIDTSNISPDDDFSLVRGIQSLVIRDVMTYRNPSMVQTIDVQEYCEEFGGTWSGTCDLVPDEMYIFPDNNHNYFPCYVDTGYNQNIADGIYNILQPIQLGYNQFPQLSLDFCVFTNEG